MRFIWPLDDHVVTRGFDYKADLYVGGQHAAIDLIRRLAITRGSPIKSVAAGMVVDNRWDTYSGNLVSVSHEGGWSSHYRHLIMPSPAGVGTKIQQGQIIGNVGNTGVSQGAHLHFDLWCATKHDNTAFAKRGLWAHNPELYLDKEEDDMALTAEQHAMLQTVHHFAKISGPALLGVILANAKAANAQARAANAKCMRVEAKLNALIAETSGRHAH